MGSISVAYDEADDFIRVVIRGSVDLPLIESLRSQAMQLVLAHNCVRVLADLRAADSAISTVEIFDQPQRTADDLANIGLTTTQFWRAFVIEEESEDIRFFETVATNRGHSVKVFRNLDDAKDWLMKCGRVNER